MIINDAYTVECLKAYFPADQHYRFVVPLSIEPEELIARALQLDDEGIEGIANCLKMGVEHSADSDPELAFRLAKTIIDIGRACENGSLIGLSLMAEGDILAHSGRNREAWEKLDEAGREYLAAGDEFGWARTRIGRLLISPELDAGCVEVAFSEAAQAEAIFLAAERFDRLFRLYHNWAFAHVLMGQYEEAVAHYQNGVHAVEKLDDPSSSFILIAHFHSDMGYAYNNLGQLETAMHYLTDARQVLTQTEHHYTAALTGLNMANNYVIQGRYRQALHLLLNSVLPNLSAHRANAARLTIVDCYLELNRNLDAYELAKEIVDVSNSDPDRVHQTAMSALLLATAQTRLGYLAEAQESLALAEANFSAFENLGMLIQLRRGQIALLQRDFAGALSIAETAAQKFGRWQQPMHWIDAMLLGVEASLGMGLLDDAYRLGRQALHYAREQGLLPACYRCCVALGQILEQQGREESAVRLYRVALSTLRQIQRSLTISLRANFLEDKLLPFRRLMQIYMARGQVDAAFHTLEQLKAQVFMDFLAQRELLEWVDNDQTRPLVEALRKLREQYRWLLQLQSAPPIDMVKTNPWYGDASAYTELQQAVVDCEKQIRQITEQLYLFQETEPAAMQDAPRLSAVQEGLDDDTLLVEFYADREQVWCIGITRDGAAVHALPEPVTTVQRLIEDKWRSNLEFALQVGPDDRRAVVLTEKAKLLGEKLYQMLLAPLTDQMQRKSRIVIVPYGFLHQLPFNILRHGGCYLIETHEIVILPSASFLLRPDVHRQAGAVVAAHSWGGRLAYSIPEGQMVNRRMGGSLALEEDANRALLMQPPCKVLHISSHGEHRIDQPDFAYLELGDGPVYTDDLLQCDLSYELVVLSACEVGRANVTAGDELIGLGRGFLYAGAGALITSLWRVNEHYTFQLMDSLYRALGEGESKAAALRCAQRELLAHHADLHPAFWSAFQLICNPNPIVSL